MTNLTTISLTNQGVRQLTLDREEAGGGLSGLVAEVESKSGTVWYLSGEPRLGTRFWTSNKKEFRFLLTGSAGTYQIQVSTDLLNWTGLQLVSLGLSSAMVIDASAPSRPVSLYRAVRLE